MLSSALLSLLAVVPLAAAAPAPAPAVFNVGATGGNATSPYQYGFVITRLSHLTSPNHITVSSTRTSTTLVMAVSTLNSS